MDSSLLFRDLSFHNHVCDYSIVLGQQSQSAVAKDADSAVPDISDRCGIALAYQHGQRRAHSLTIVSGKSLFPHFTVCQSYPVHDAIPCRIQRPIVPKWPVIRSLHSFREVITGSTHCNLRSKFPAALASHSVSEDENSG